MLNVRLSDDEKEILELYAADTNSSMSGVVKAYINGLKSKVTTITAENVDPIILPSVPLTKSNLAPTVMCIYFFIDDNHNIIYVGSTKDLKKRLSTHHKKQAAIEVDGRTRLHWIEVKSDRAILRLEKDFIKKLKPMLNF